MVPWHSVVKKAKKIGHKVNKTVHSYPKLPKFSLGVESLPFQIGSKVSVKDYNTFLDHNESSGYKFHWDNGNVYIVEMAYREHEVVVSYLQDCFKEPNNGVKRGPIKVMGQPYHYNPIGNGEKIASDIAVCASNAHYILPSIPHSGPPARDAKGNPHARIICKVANTQSITSWNTKCETWMHENYVRCVLGIKFYPKTIIGRTVHQVMIARLWTRNASAGGVLSTDATLATAGVYVTEWDFGTIQYNNITPTPTGCNALNLNAFQITIPIADVFWDPPIVGGVPTPYAVFVPGTVVGTNFVIDLFDVQQEILEAL